MKKIALGAFLSLLLVAGSFGLAGATGQNGTTLSATVSMDPTWTSTWNWTIDKSVTPENWNLFQGDSGTSRYTVAVTKSEAPTDYSDVSGEVCVTNGGAVATTDLAITANLTMPPSATIIGTTSVDVSGHPILAAGETHCYPYTIVIASPTASATYKVTADITITNHSGHLNQPFGPNPSASGAFLTSPTVINDSINVEDSNGSSWTFSTSGSEEYDKTFTCDADEGEHGNTATITETGQNDSAAVTVNCYELEVSKTAATSLDRTYHWTIEKSADQSTLILAPNQEFTVNYTVLVNSTGSTDSNWAANGTITVHNPAPIAATVNGVSDLVSPDIAGSVVCPGTFPQTIAAGEDLICTYTAALPDATSRVNTATATLQNYDYDSELNATAAGTADFSGTADVDFSGAAINEIDKTVTVTDTYQGTLGALTYGVDTLPHAYTYPHTFGPYTESGTYSEENVAAIVGGETSIARGSFTVNIQITEPGCTLTIGYWKNHAGLGKGNQNDMVTPLLPRWLGSGSFGVGVNTNSLANKILSMNYSVATNTTSGASNGITKLYAQLLAAKLNIANGASATAIGSTITTADGFLATRNQSNWSGLSKTWKNQVNSWMTALDNYNNGLTGPGHCSQ